jgi:hypothetical protein
MKVSNQVQRRKRFKAGRQMQTRHHCHIWIGIPVLFFLCLLTACGDNEKETAETPGQEFAINKEYTSGPCTLGIHIDKQEITIAESVTMTINVTVNKEYTIEFPEFGENLDQFSIQDFYESSRTLVDDEHISIQQEYILEPYLSGTYTIPPIRIRFYTDAEGPENAHILESEEFTITVTSLLDEDKEDITINDITGPVLPPPPDLTWLYLLIAGILTGGAGITFLVIFLVKKRQNKQHVITIPAHELAFRRLEVLVAQNYIEKGEIKLFYFEISKILREYIENRFHLHAPEQTTEEFLYDLKESSYLHRELKEILKEFLSHCDLVKFAKHNPTTEEIQKTFTTCKDFILTTEDVNARVEEPGDTSTGGELPGESQTITEEEEEVDHVPV